MPPESKPDTPLLFTPIAPRGARPAWAAFGVDPEFADWPEQYGWWLAPRARSSEFYDEAEERAPAAE